MKYCGVDEAGRGSVMGPLVVAIVRTDGDDGLVRMGVKDSKKLTPRRREILYGEICDRYEVESLEVSAEEIDAFRKKISLNEIESNMFAEAVKKLGSGLVYADCPDVNTAAFSDRLSKKCGEGYRIIAEHRADDTYPVVSAASIVAKVLRDRRITEISEELGESVGSGYPSDRVTMEFIERWIKEKRVPPPHTRCSWEPVRNLMTLAANTRLSDW